MNLILNSSKNIMTTNFFIGTHYDIGDLNFYIPQKSLIQHTQVYVMLKNTKGIYEIVELEKVDSSGSNDIYRFSLEQPMRIKDEKVELKILLLNGANGTYIVSNPFDIYLHTNNYVPARQIYIARDIGARMQELYIEVLALTEENRKLVDEIRERGHKE